MTTAYVRAKREWTVLHRHPWIFSGAVERLDGDAGPGDVVRVADARGETLGYGAWSPHSQIRVRMLSFDPRRPADAAFVKAAVAASVARRGAAAFAPHAGTRLVHGESDGLPGVVADCYDGWCVVQLASAGAEKFKDAIAAALVAAGAKGVYNRSDVDSRLREGLAVEGASATGPLAGGEPPELVEIHEGAIKYFVDVRRGHKTGFYLDQREARACVGALAAGRDCLNCFSYTGGFGLACAAGGAVRVENVDLSAPALALAEKNFALTFPGGAPCETAFVCADVFKHLRLCRDRGRQFDLIVLDPPKFADAKSQLMRATRGYKDINLLAMKLLRPGGVLATFSCSGAMTQDLFDKVCAEAAFDARRDFQVIARTRQAADHPVALSFPEGFYLKGLVLRAI